MQGDTCKKTPNCSGVIDDTDYCDTCGLKADGAAPAATIGDTGSTRSKSGVSISAPLSRGTAGSGSRRSAPTGVSTTRTRGIGLGYVDIARQTPVAFDAMKDNGVVPEHKRICGTCEGRGVHQVLKREEGACGKCGTRYSFKPKLTPGQFVGDDDQYEIKIRIAFGGMGWIYGAWDRKVGRPVVLKGLLNTADAALAAAAEQEKRMLAKIKHGRIVGIYNFITVDGFDYIVMEYVGGKTLKQIRKERGPLPVEEAIAYIYAICSAFNFLHSQTPAIICNDFKPDNVMLEGDDVKMIDLGALIEADDLKSDIYGTEGYAAPEAGKQPSIPADIFTIGRTLAVLVLGDPAHPELNFPGFTKQYLYTLPTPDQAPVFAENDSLYRVLLKATAQNPDDRFQTVDEFADQLLGVLREIVARKTGVARPSTSELFADDPLTTLPEGEAFEADYRSVPTLLVEANDEAANWLLRNAGTDAARRLKAMEGAKDQFPNSRELPLRMADALIELGQFAEAKAILDDLKQKDPWNWRVDWTLGRLLLAQDKAKEAKSCFDSVYCDLPGEMATKLAVALAAEALGDLTTATTMFGIVSTTDAGFVGAAFGLARCNVAAGNRDGAVAALERVPQASSLYTLAQMTAARILVKPELSPGDNEFEAASAKVEALSLQGAEHFTLVRDLLERALEQVTSGNLRNSSAKLLGQPLDEISVRRGLENAFRQLAHLTTGDEKIALVDKANSVRPSTLF
jgi:serine/threonine-protein kinase PknG